MQVRQILFPTDASPLARAAFPLALQLARRFGARLHLLRVLPFQAGLAADPLLPYSVLAEIDEQAEREAVAELQGLATEAATAGVEVVTAHPRSSTVGGILDYIEGAAIDLTVMATHGRRGPARALFGSVAEEVLRHGSCPVLTVHGDDVDRAAGSAPGIGKILVPFDFSPFSRAALIDAVDLARRWGARLELLHVLEELPAETGGPPATEKLRAAQECRARQLRLRLLDLLAYLGEGLQGEAVVRIGRPGPEILRSASAGGIDLIVMATHGVTGIKRVFLGSTAEDVLRGAVTPVLVVKPELAEPAWKTSAGRFSDGVPIAPAGQGQDALASPGQRREESSRKVFEVMRCKPRVATPEMALEHAAQLMAETGEGFLPVVSGLCRVEGVLTDRDVCLARLASSRGPAQSLVRQAMSEQAWTCRQDDEVNAALDIMTAHRVRRLPVVDSERQLVGVVRLDDLAAPALPAATAAVASVAG